MNDFECLEKIFSAYTCNKKAISLLQTEINRLLVILCLDSTGLIHLWNLNETHLNLNDDCNELSEFGECKVIYPTVSFYMEDLCDEKDLIFSKLAEYEDKLILIGNFNTIVINKEQIAQRLSNLKQIKSKIHSDHYPVVKIPMVKLNSNRRLDDSVSFNNKTLLGCDFALDQGIFFSEDKIISYDMNTLKQINTVTSFKSNCKITDAKILTNNKGVVYSTNEGNLIFLTPNLSQVGNFNIGSNKYTDYLQNEQCKESYRINCIQVTKHYLVIGCNSFAVKYNHFVNAATLALYTNGEVNDILCEEDTILFATDGEHLMKYKLTHKSFQNFKSTNSCNHVLNKILLNGQQFYISGGDSNVIDVFNDELVLNLIF